MKWIHHIIYGSLLVSVAAWTSCGTRDNRTPNGDTPEPEDQEAKKALQGIWIDQETETVSFCAKGTAKISTFFEIASGWKEKA